MEIIVETNTAFNQASTRFVSSDASATMLLSSTYADSELLLLVDWGVSPLGVEEAVGKCL